MFKDEFKGSFGKKVSLDQVTEESIWYTVQCGCGDSNHNAKIEVSCEDGEINLCFYKTVSYNWWDYNETTFFDKLESYFNRFKKAVQLIFTGNLEMSEFFLINDEDQANDFVKAIQEGIEYCKKDDQKIIQGNLFATTEVKNDN